MSSIAIHPADPQARLIRRAADCVRSGGVIAYPTDTTYALGCRIGDKDASDRMRAIRALAPEHHLTLVCSGIGQAALYARMDDMRFRTIKRAGSGEYVFILPATREVPRRLQHPQKKAIGVRLTVHPVAAALIAELAEPLLSTTLQLPGDDYPMNDADEIRARMAGRIDLILDAGPCGMEPSTVVDLTGVAPVVIRKGKGPIDRLGLPATD
ncbi:MAG: threonylcarbamoyl-AMP synthase [Betaproteobacteria bacterium]|nr:threonylcarbamoyl-AMP synthase [Betaproteobacteria bacterium]